MSYYAKCPMDIWVMLPDGIEKAKGDQIPCPHECGRCSSQCFNTVFVKNRIPATYCKYNDHEIVSVWNLDIPSQASIAPLRSREAVETNTASNSRNVETSPEDDLSVKGVQSAYEAYANMDLFASNADTATDEIYGDKYDVPNLNTKSILNLGGLLYTDNEVLLKQRRYSPLRNAFIDILRLWDTRAVFSNYDATELSDNFKWLLEKKLSSHYSKKRIENILSNDQLNRSEKMFALFYGELFVWKKQDLGGFYWCDEIRAPAPLNSHFTDFNDFSQKYSDGSLYGERFRTFVRNHFSSILLYFNFKDKAELFDAIIEHMAYSHKRIVYIDSEKAYNLGTIKEFELRMHTPSDYQTMYLMCEFLKRYCISKSGIVKRTHTPFNFSVSGEEAEDDCRFDIFEVKDDGNLADKYNLFVSLLIEYMVSFNPEKIKVGTLSFSANNFFKDLEAIVGDYCRDTFSRKGNDINMRYRNAAFLTLSLYQRKVFVPYYRGYDRNIADLISLLKSPAIDQYYKIIENPLVYRHNSVESISLGDYIQDRIREQNTLPGLVSALNVNLIAAFTSSNKPSEGDVQDLRNKIQNLLGQ